MYHLHSVIQRTIVTAKGSGTMDWQTIDSGGSPSPNRRTVPSRNCCVVGLGKALLIIRKDDMILPDYV